MNKSVLVVAPHADDEVLGCGATIRKHVLEGDDVYVIVMTNAFVGAPEIYTEEGCTISRNEALSAHKVLGVKKTIFFDFPAPVLDQFPEYKMASEIARVINEYSIHTVYLPWRGDIHIDHKVVYNVGLVACRPIGNYSVKRVLAYETLSETEWSAPFGSEVFIPNVFVVLTEEQFEAKINAMKCYRSQIKEFPASRSIETLTALSRFRGSTISKERAEAFAVIRDIT
jgi:Uncharacterized proteins, LmbE homologs